MSTTVTDQAMFHRLRVLDLRKMNEHDPSPALAFKVHAAERQSSEDVPALVDEIVRLRDVVDMRRQMFAAELPSEMGA